MPKGKKGFHCLRKGVNDHRHKKKSDTAQYFFLEKELIMRKDLSFR